MRGVRLFLVLALGFFSTGCASPGNREAAAADDPLEPTNRFIFNLNQSLDRQAALPAASFYSHAVPGGARRNVHNFLSNIDGPPTAANDLLQGEISSAGVVLGRFVVNSTIGIGGLFDVATDWGLPTSQEDFGQTLGLYGIGAGPYLVLPLRGPSSVRDFTGSYVDGFFSPFYYIHYSGRQYTGLVRASLGSVDNRSANIVTYRDIERASVDYYATMRTYYQQKREAAVENLPETDNLPDF